MVVLCSVYCSVSNRLVPHSFRYAASLINRNSAVLTNTKLVVDVAVWNKSLHTTYLEACIDMVKRGAKENKTYYGMLTRFSSWSKAMLSVRDSVLPMPVVGFEASSPVLSNATEYPNFVRLQVSDTRNALALARLAKTMGFTSIFIVCEGTDSWAVDYKDAFVAAMDGSSTNVGYLNKNNNLTALIRDAEDVVKGMRGYSVVLVAAGSTIMKTSRFFEAFSATDVGTLPHAFLFASTSTLGKMAADPRLTADARRVLDGSLALEVRLKESEMNGNETSDDWWEEQNLSLISHPTPPNSTYSTASL